MSKINAVIPGILALFLSFFLFNQTGYAQKGFKSKEKAEGNLLYRKLKQLSPLCKKMTKPKKGSWLAKHPEEKGQTFKQYINSHPILPRGRKDMVYIQPLGTFSKKEQKMIEVAVEFLRKSFGLKVAIKPTLPLNIVEKTALRQAPGNKHQQISTSYIFEKTLHPRLPNDAVAYIAIASSDLWNGKNDDIIIGQEMLNNREAVWSLYQFSRDAKMKHKKVSFRKRLLRLIKALTRQTARMFSMKYCTAYECGMNGSSTLREFDKHPLALCPECLPKICMVGKLDPITRARNLAELCRKYGLKKQAAYYEKCIEILTNQ